MGYKVVAPMVALRVKDPTGAVVIRNYYAGAPVPEETTPESLQHHIDSALVVEEGTLASDFVAVPAGTPIPGEPPNVPVTEQTPVPRAVPERVEAAVKAAEAGLGQPSQEPDGVPRRSASKDAWHAHALTVETGKGRDEAEARAELDPLTRDELVERYGR